MEKKFEVNPGDLSKSIKSEDWNSRLEEIEKFSNAFFGEGLSISGPGSIKVDPTAGLWARLIGTANPYGFAESRMNVDGTWSAVPNGLQGSGGPTGTSPAAYEVNGSKKTSGANLNLNGQITWLTPGFADDYRFQWIGIGSGGGGGGIIVTIPMCFCHAIPATLKMTSNDPTCNYRMFQSCTIQYGPTPSGYANLNLPANTFLSVQSFPDPLSGGAIFRYYLTCLYNMFSLSRVYLTSPFGSPFRDGVLYSWILGGYGNNCSPFQLDNGSAYPGSDASCGVKIDP